MNLSDNSEKNKPVAFDFDLPIGYPWLSERNLIGFKPFTQLQPWFYLDSNSVFNVSSKWPHGPIQEGMLIAFAKRQDCDDIACFHVIENSVQCIFLIHGWTNEGYDVLEKHDSFWMWLKSIIDDIAEWVENAG